MTFGSTVDLLDIGMGDFVQPDMTAFAFQLPVHGTGKLFIVYIKNPFDTGFVVAPHSGISMTIQTIFGIRKRAGFSQDDIRVEKQKKDGNGKILDERKIARSQDGSPVFLSFVSVPGCDLYNWVNDHKFSGIISSVQNPVQVFWGYKIQCNS